MNGRSAKELTREAFAIDLVVTLAGNLDGMAAPEDVRSVVGLTGLEMGEAMEAAVAADAVADPEGEWTPKDLGAVLVELKRRIDGDFEVEEANEERVVLTNGRCPFGADVDGRPSLCMMTSSVFGGIAARRFGYSRVDVEKAIARGDAGCRVTVHLQRPDEKPGEWSREYFGEE